MADNTKNLGEYANTGGGRAVGFRNGVTLGGKPLLDALRDVKVQSAQSEALREAAINDPLWFFVKIMLPLLKAALPKEVNFEHRGGITVSHEVVAAFGRLSSLSDSELDALIQDGARACAESGILEDCEGETEPVVSG